FSLSIRGRAQSPSRSFAPSIQNCSRCETSTRRKNTPPRSVTRVSSPDEAGLDVRLRQHPFIRDLFGNQLADAINLLNPRDHLWGKRCWTEHSFPLILTNRSGHTEPPLVPMNETSQIGGCT